MAGTGEESNSEHSGESHDRDPTTTCVQGPQLYMGLAFPPGKRELRTWEGQRQHPGDRPRPGRETQEDRDEHALGRPRHREKNAASGIGSAIKNDALAG